MSGAPERKAQSPALAALLILIGTGVIMFVVSICIWPSPAVALVGAIILPLVLQTGVPVVWAAVAMNLFGHGIALSGDYFIQGAPTITAKAAALCLQPFDDENLPDFIATADRVRTVMMRAAA